MKQLYLIVGLVLSVLLVGCVDSGRELPKVPEYDIILPEVPEYEKIYGTLYNAGSETVTFRIYVDGRTLGEKQIMPKAEEVFEDLIFWDSKQLHVSVVDENGNELGSTVLNLTRYPRWDDFNVIFEDNKVIILLSTE